MLKWLVLTGVMLKGNKQVILLEHWTDSDCFSNSRNTARWTIANLHKSWFPTRLESVPIGNCKDLNLACKLKPSARQFSLYFFSLNQTDHIKHEGYSSSTWNPSKTFNSNKQAEHSLAAKKGQCEETLVPADCAEKRDTVMFLFPGTSFNFTPLRCPLPTNPNYPPPYPCKS